ncbi:serine hydrolase [Fluviicola taffensis]|uniref:Beta-lactamase n=1 Tax=Fluviicola taffensis (strain DSM 16823 / NCIMB 13979 / RW262) TaxID=755732 RepID=F2IEL3_FLUTR|nr:serine hydrolase [Fluviicola taffensis]AEA44552.1 beta-lactamase [Fluviicola taffensis DSM 16823]
MKQILILLFTTTFIFSATSQSKEKKPDFAKRLSGIEKELNQVLVDQKVAGYSVAVVYKDKIIYSKGFGYRDLENKKPVTPNTLFAIGSSTKAFTSAILGQLEKEEKLKLKDLATSHLPQLSFKYDYLNTGITIRDMMCHRTGFSRFDYSWYFFNTSNRDSLISRVKYMEPTVKLREKWQYNNWMFLAQGMIAEKITEKTWEQNIQERFFTPLKMTHSNTDIFATQKDADASLPYTLDSKMSIKKMDYYNINGMGPAGSINSCANDMGNWVATWIMGGKFNESEIIPSSYVKDASSSQMVVRGGQPTDHSDIQFTNYGLGWFLESYRGHFLVEHGGNINGFSANVAFYPSDSIGIVVLTNQNGSEVPEIVRNFISDKLFALSPIPWNADAKKAKDEMMAEVKKLESKADTTSLQVKNTQPSHPLKDYAGYYSNDAYGNFTVVYENDTLKTFLAGEKMWMSHYHYDIFNLESVKKEDEEDESKFLLNFASASNGKIDRVSLDLDEPEKTTEFLRSTPKVELSNDDLTKYVGDYDLEGNTIKVYIKGKVLMVLVPGQPDYETASIGNDTFELTIAKGYSVKFTMDNGKSIAVVFQQPNGNFTAKRK